jgi:hypothetical protein
LSEVVDYRFIGHATDLGEGGDCAVEGFGGEVAEGKGLVVGDASGAELLVGAVEEVLGGEVLVAGDGIEALEEATVNGGCGFAVELLVDDGFDEGFEGGLGAGEAHGEGTGALNEAAELGIGSGELCDGSVGVVGWTARASDGARHGMTVSELIGGKGVIEDPW